MAKKKVTASVFSQRQLTENIYDMWIETDLAKEALPGQFLMVYPKCAATLLPRPISICEAQRDVGRLRIVYRVAGKGTAEFASYRKGDPISVMGTLGNGFPLQEAAGKRVFLMGGGIGIPPLLGLLRALSGAGQISVKEAERASGECADISVGDGRTGDTAPLSVHAILGYRDNRLFLKEDFDHYSNVVIATEDGSAGTKGNILNAVNANGLSADLIYACGPMPMLRAVKQYAAKEGIPAYLSLEERMACGVGACLGCVCKTTHKDAHSHVNNARVCTEGPVFLAEDVEI
jgi:dihydroorotate dehydrogenase electron transfer subunit